MRRKNVHNMVVQSQYSGEYFIATSDEDWQTRLANWKREHLLNPKTTTPCPMPVGHLMFKNAGTTSSQYAVVSWENL